MDRFSRHLPDDHNDEIFKDRKAAGIALAGALAHLKGSDSIILAIPRGGVPVGFEISKSLKIPLDILLSKKIGHPANPEYAIGAVTPEDRVLSPTMDVTDVYIEQETLRIRRELSLRYKSLRGDIAPVEIRGKNIIIVDDGIATGQTLAASIQMIRRQMPERIILAVPVAPDATCRWLKPMVDELIVLRTPTHFSGVGAYYEDFSQVEDAEVAELLLKAGDARPPGGQHS